MSQSPDKVYFKFKMRVSAHEWQMISNIMMGGSLFYNHKAQRDWLFNQVNRFCREVAVPYIEQHTRTHVVEKNILIQEVPFGDSTNIRILREFAEIHEATVTEVIQKYILDIRVVREEMIQAAGNGPHLLPSGTGED